MFSSFFHWLFVPVATPSPRTVPLGLDAFEDRVVPSSVTFTSGILCVQSDAATNDFVLITAAGSKHDGSTGVELFTNVTGKWTLQKFGDATHPVTNIALDMKDGNDFVDVASLSKTVVLVGEGNGNNFVRIGETLSGAVVAGSGKNVISVGNGTVNGFGSFNLPGVASSAAFVGWGYNFGNGGTGIWLNGNTGNTHNNVVYMGSKAGYESFVDLVGTGNNLIHTGAGNDGVSVLGGGNNVISTGAGNDFIHVGGDGNNQIHAGTGSDTVTINGNGNNTVSSHGSGSIVVDGSGKNAVHARHSTGLTVGLNGVGAGSSIVATLTDEVFVGGVPVTASGVVGNVKVELV